MQTEDHIQPTRSMRLRLLALWLPMFLGLPLLFAAGVQAYLRHVVPMPLCDQLPWMQLIVAMVCLALLGAAVFIGSWAWRVAKSGQFPPPGARVFFRTRIQRGWLAWTQAASGAAISLGLFWLVLWVCWELPISALLVSKSECRRQMAFEQAKREACRSATASDAAIGVAAKERGPASTTKVTPQ